MAKCYDIEMVIPDNMTAVETKAILALRRAARRATVLQRNRYGSRGTVEIPEAQYNAWLRASYEIFYNTEELCG